MTEFKNTKARGRNSTTPGNNYHNRAMEGGFASLRDKIQTTKKHHNDHASIAVNSLGDDGVDHINVHHHAKTALGKALSIYGDYPFVHNRYGTFRTIHGLMGYLGSESQPDVLRELDGFEVRRMLDKYPVTLFVKDYAWTVLDATWQKIQAHPVLAQQLKDSNLPFDFYYKQNTNQDTKESIRVRIPSTYRWITEGLEELRAALREGREPDLTFLTTTEKPQRAALEKPPKPKEDKRQKPKSFFRQALQATMEYMQANDHRHPHPIIGSDLLYYKRLSKFKHSRLRIRGEDIERLILQADKRSNTEWVELIKAFCHSHYQHWHRVGVVVDPSRKDERVEHWEKDRYVAYSIYEVVFGPTRYTATKVFVAARCTDNQPFQPKRISCHEGALMQTFTVMLPQFDKVASSWTTEFDVILNTESHVCSANYPRIATAYLPEALRALEFTPVPTDSDEGEAPRFYTNMSLEPEVTEYLIKVHLGTIEQYYESFFRVHRKYIKSIMSMGYIVDTQWATDDRYRVYEAYQITYGYGNDPVPGGEPGERIDDVLWYYGDWTISERSRIGPYGLIQNLEKTPTETEEIEDREGIIELKESPVGEDDDFVEPPPIEGSDEPEGLIDDPAENSGE